jgi:hypothetical protein
MEVSGGRRNDQNGNVSRLAQDRPPWGREAELEGARLRNLFLHTAPANKPDRDIDGKWRLAVEKAAQDKRPRAGLEGDEGRGADGPPPGWFLRAGFPEEPSTPSLLV